MDENTTDASAAVPVDPGTVFAAIADLTYRGSEPAEIYTAITVAATMLVPGCDHASLMLVRNGKYTSVAATDSVALQVDEIELATGEGACLDAIDSEAAAIEPNLQQATRWPNFARRVVAETPVRSAMGFRLLVDSRKVGALDLFSDTPDAFDDAAAGNAIVLAAFASVTVTAVSRGEDATTLRQGLDSNREIGTALGLLMAMHDVSTDEAFSLLRRTSQQVNVKVAELARTVVDEHRNTSEGTAPPE